MLLLAFFLLFFSCEKNNLENSTIYKNIYEFIKDNENANHINFLANQVYSAFLNMQEIKSKTALVISKDIKYFKETLDLIEKFTTSKNTFQYV